MAKKKSAPLSIFTRESAASLKKIRAALLKGTHVRVVNAYETFYGCSFDSWLRKGLSDLHLDLKFCGVCEYHPQGFIWSYDITPIV